jgi:hypothetical protein
MGLFGMFDGKPAKPNQPPAVDAVLREIAPHVFPRGHSQVISEGIECRKIIGNALSENEVVQIYARSKTLIYLAKDKSAARCCESILVKSRGRINSDQAWQIYNYACRNLKLNSSSLHDCCKNIGKAFQLGVEVNRDTREEVTHGTFDSKQRIVYLASQNTVPYLCDFGSILCQIIMAEDQKIGQYLIRVATESLESVCRDLGEYNSGQFGFTYQFIYDAFGGFATIPKTWSSAFETLAGNYTNPQHKLIVQSLGASTCKAVDSCSRATVLKPYAAFDMIGNSAKFANAVSWALASYANLVKNSPRR